MEQLQKLDGVRKTSTATPMQFRGGLVKIADRGDVIRRRNRWLRRRRTLCVPRAPNVEVAFAWMEFVATRRVRAHAKRVPQRKRGKGPTEHAGRLRSTAILTRNANPVPVTEREAVRASMVLRAAVGRRVCLGIASMGFAVVMRARARAKRVPLQNEVVGTMGNAGPLLRGPILTTNARILIAMVRGPVRCRRDWRLAQRVVRMRNAPPASARTAFVAIRLVPELAKLVRRRKRRMAPTVHVNP